MLHIRTDVNIRTKRIKVHIAADPASIAGTRAVFQTIAQRRPFAINKRFAGALYLKILIAVGFLANVEANLYGIVVKIGFNPPQVIRKFRAVYPQHQNIITRRNVRDVYPLASITGRVGIATAGRQRRAVRCDTWQAIGVDDGVAGFSGKIYLLVVFIVQKRLCKTHVMEVTMAFCPFVSVRVIRRSARVIRLIAIIPDGDTVI